MPERTYVFFSHTLKAQPYNMPYRDYASFSTDFISMDTNVIFLISFKPQLISIRP